MQRSGLEHARATSREPQEIRRAYGVNPQKSIEDRGYKKSSAGVWFVCLLVLVRVGIVSFPYACGLIGLANRIAQGASKARRAAEFPGELTQQVLMTLQIASGQRNLMAENVGECKMLK